MPTHESHTILERWRRKFAQAFRGVAVGVRGQSSFYVHGFVSLVVVVVAAWLNVSPVEWSILFICIACVLAAELFNSAIEHLAKAITTEQHPEIRNALDIASGAVLVLSLGAALVGLILLVRPLLELFLGW